MNIIKKSLILLVLLWFSAPSWLSHTELIDCSQEKLQHTKRSFPVSANFYTGLNSISRDSNEQYLAQAVEYLDHPIIYSAVNHTTTHIGSRRDAAADVAWLRQSKFHKNFSSLTYIVTKSSDDYLLNSACLPLIATHFILLSMPLLEWHRRSKNCAISICICTLGWATRWSE